MNIQKVAVGISGGVDSAIAAYLLKTKGYKVHGVYMKNWDIADEQGVCSSDNDFQDAQKVCSHLKIPLSQVNFVKEYWNEVFTNFVQDYITGFTPNPDILCNRHIKFNYFLKFAKNSLKCDAIATGHYANSTFGNYLEHFKKDSNVDLLQAADSTKDQTFFLSQIKQEALKCTMFPIGNMFKNQVKKLACEIGLYDIAKKKESMGICFIGSRNFQNFISDYVVDAPGDFVDIDSGKIMGRHKGVHHWTIGQRTKLSGHAQAIYVAKKDDLNQIIFVAPGGQHPALHTELFYTTTPHWINEQKTSTKSGLIRCQFKFQHTYDAVDCDIFQIPSKGAIVHLPEPMRALAPGQYAAFYQDKVCLGSARILKNGITSFTLNYIENFKNGIKNKRAIL